MLNEDGVVITRSALRRVLLGVVIAAATLLALVAFQQRDALAGLLRSPGDPATYVDQGTYQAVFLTGGQVYFGKLVPRGEVYLMSDVYYLSTPTEAQPAGQLIKRGNEVHGPREPMVILASQVLLIENQRPDSEVMAAIARFKSGERPSATPPPLGQSPRPSATAPR